MKFKIIAIWLILFSLGIVSGKAYLKYLNHHPITLRHPCPQLTKAWPVLKYIDQTFSITAGVYWYKVKSRAGKEYFMNRYTIFSSDFGMGAGYAIMDVKERKRWIELTEEQYRYLFESPANYKGYVFPYDLKEDK